MGMTDRSISRSRVVQAAADRTAVPRDDATLFGGLIERHRRELHVHCYRILGSFDEAEELVQETLLRAWQGRRTFSGAAPIRSWLYRIATNACLDTLRLRARRVPTDAFADVTWLQPYPDRLLDELAATDAGPDAAVVARETIELVFLAILQTLPPRQRAVLVLRDILDWSAAETAETLGTTVVAVNSAVQRARETLRRRLAAGRLDGPGTGPTDQEAVVVARFIAAVERGDADAAVALAHEDIRIAMPPIRALLRGRAAFADLAQRGLGPEAMGEWRLLATAANRQPAIANYLRRPQARSFEAFKIDVLSIHDGRIVEIVTFGPGLFQQFGLPSALDERA